MKKCFVLGFSVLLLVLSFTGCSPELYERLLISAIGVDRTEDGCRVTVRVALAQEDGAEVSLTGEGKTVPEALNRIALSTGQKPLYSHNTMVVFGMDCASEGLDGYIDFFIRHYDSRPTVKVFLSETTAEDILRVEENADTPRAGQIADLVKGEANNGLFVDANFIDLIHGSYGKAASAVLPVLRREESVLPAGTALLNGFTFQRMLSEEETQGSLLLNGKLTGGQVVVSDPECGEVSISIEDSSSALRFTGTAENPRFEISLQIEGEIGAISGGQKHLASDVFPRLEQAFSERISACVEAYLSATVYESGCDTAEFSGAVLRDAPDVWHLVSENRAEFLKRAVFDLHIEARIARVEEEDTPYF